jgi:hypothetical protein
MARNPKCLAHHHKTCLLGSLKSTGTICRCLFKVCPRWTLCNGVYGYVKARLFALSIPQSNDVIVVAPKTPLEIAQDRVYR